MKVLVTGGGGFIGRHLVTALKHAGHDVTALFHYRSTPQLETTHTLYGDVRDESQMSRYIAKYERVYHLAALIDIPYSYEASRQYMDTNAIGTLNVCKACTKHRVELIHTSTSEVYGTAQYTPQDESHPINAQSPYAASKVAADAIVNAFIASYGMMGVTVRPFNTYGSGQSTRAVLASVLHQSIHNDTITIQDGSPTRDFVHVSDTVRAFMAVSPDGQVYNVATGRSISILNAAKLLSKNKPVVCTGVYRPSKSEVYALCGNYNKINRRYNWKPTVTLEAYSEHCNQVAE